MFFGYKKKHDFRTPFIIRLPTWKMSEKSTCLRPEVVRAAEAWVVVA